ncbi:GtrA family protein [Paenibacillus mucilaginosus]|uniref:GtrA family protein n=1 Tax=Paenibacillus mucilaginosus TaxID=61624 RepID=UPI003D1B7A6C
MLINNTFVKFILVGVLNTVVGTGAMLILNNFLDIDYWFSTFFGNLIGATVSYFLNKNFTFQNNDSFVRTFLLFSITIVSCYFLAYGLSRILVRSINTMFLTEKIINNDNLSIILGTGLYTILNYLGQKVIVFKNNSR